MSVTGYVKAPNHLVLQVAGGGMFELQGFQATYQANGINVCQVILAVGKRDGQGASVSLNIEQGAEARVTCTKKFGQETFEDVPGVNPNAFTKDGSFLLFDGVVDDFGPTTLRSGVFALEVRLFGRLVYLASGTLETSNIMPKSYWDVNVAYPFGAGEDDREFIETGEALSLGTEGFLSALRNAFIRVASQGASPAPPGSLTRIILDNFGSSLNQEAVNVLGALEGQLLWRGSVVDAVPAMVVHFNEQLRANWFYGSFLEALIRLGEQLMFSIVENGEGIAVVPYHPFTTDNQKRLVASTWDSFQWVLDNYSNYAGVVLTESQGNEPRRPHTGEGLVAGLARINAFRYGRVHVGPAPSFMATISDSMRFGANDEARVTGSAEQIRAMFGDGYAMIKALELNFESRRCRITSPVLRTDIGPLSNVQIEFPQGSVLAATDLALYGSVQAVTISIDAARKYAQTIYDVGYVRSRNQQRRIIQAISPSHPFFDRPYSGERLDRSPAPRPGFQNLFG